MCIMVSLSCRTFRYNTLLFRHPAVIGTDVFDMEKPLVFIYEDILSSTDGFSDSNLLGHGTYGSVYYAILRNQVNFSLLHLS